MSYASISAKLVTNRTSVRREKAHFSGRVLGSFFIIIFLQIVYMQNLQSAEDSRKCCKVSLLLFMQVVPKVLPNCR